MNKKQYIGIIILAIIILGFLFYWYDIRVSLIKSDCSSRALLDTADDENYTPARKGEIYDFYYKKCLHDTGL
jgi:hypothetical protein